MNVETIKVGPLATNAYVVPLAGGGVLLVDPGDDDDTIIAALAGRPVRAVFLTHGHYDHLAALPGVLEHCAAQTGAPPPVIIHEADSVYLGTNARTAHNKLFAWVSGGDTSFVDERWRDLPAPDRVVRNGDFVEGFVVLHLPGHSPGSAGLYDAKSGILISGDTLFCGAVGRSDLEDSDNSALERSLSRLFAELPDDTAVYPGHGAPTTIARERV